MKTTARLCRQIRVSDNLYRQIQDFVTANQSLKKPKRNLFLKECFMSCIKDFYEKQISFQSIRHYNDMLLSVFEGKKKNRILLNFTESEYESICTLIDTLQVQQAFLSRLILVVISAKKTEKMNFTTSLHNITQFFGSNLREYLLMLSVPKEINKILDIQQAENNNTLQELFRIALFYQINFSTTPSPKDENFLRVTPEKTGWKFHLFSGSKTVHRYLQNRDLGKTLPIAFLNTYLTYTESLHEQA